MTPQASPTPVESPTPVVTARPAGHRLGPIVGWRRVDGAFGRLYAAGLAVAAMAVLVTAWRLVPAAQGVGTHQQLGLPACSFLAITGLPCPTCGMTTAFACTVRGQFGAAVTSQLAGFLLAIGTVLTAVIGTVAAISGRRPSINWYRVNPMRIMWVCIATFVGAWALKIVLGLTAGNLPAR